MSLVAALILAAGPAATALPAEGSTGAELASAQVQAVILQPAIVRQGKGLETVPNAPEPQLTRRGGSIFFEFQ